MISYTGYFFRVNRDFSEATETVDFALPEGSTGDQVWAAAKAAMQAEHGHRQVDCWNFRQG